MMMVEKQLLVASLIVLVEVEVELDVLVRMHLFDAECVGAD